MNDELKIITQGLQNNYNELMNTVSKVGDLKGIIKNLSLASDEIKDSFSSILSNEKLESFKKTNHEVTQDLKKSINHIEKSINDILLQRNLFHNMIDTYQDRFERFESKVKEELEITEKLIKVVNQLMSKMENDYSTLNKKIEKFSQIVETSEILRTQDKIINEIKENRRQISKLMANQGNTNKIESNKQKDFKKNDQDPYKMNQVKKVFNNDKDNSQKK